MPGIPLPPTVELPGAFDIPDHKLDFPSFNVPTWVPIPIYRDDIPDINKTAPQSSTKKESEQKDTPKKVKKSKPKETEHTPITLPEMPPIALPSLPPLPPLPQLPAVTAPAPTIEFKEVQTVTIPFIEIDVPLPRTEIVVTAVSTAAVASVASVGGTLVATAAFKQIMQVTRPLFNTVLKKLSKARGKKTLTWSRQRIKDKPKAKGLLR